MSVRDFLLEIGTEEIPARFMPGILENLQKKSAAWLENLHIAYEELTTYGTPRRIVLHIKNLAEHQQDQVLEARGPAVKAAYDEQGNLTKAGMGFAKGQGVEPDQLETREVGANSYVFAVKHIKGEPSVNVLSSIKDVILDLPFPKNMRWGYQETKFVRPVQWLVCLYGSEVIPFSLTDRISSNITYGHRFLSKGPLEVASSADYFSVLESQFVIVDQDERKQAVLREIERIERDHQVHVHIDEDLLEEVNFLIEYPTALLGSFDVEFLEVPEQVLITSMKEHQRYFPVMDGEGNLLAHFVTIRNGNDHAIDTVRKGNEKVLRARLADARFFYEEDKKSQIDTLNQKLRSIVYHEELGTIADKVERIGSLSEQIANYIDKEQALDTIQLQRAVQICKFDLVTNMVYEFPELQGVIGKHYAELAGEATNVSQAVFEHYLPRFAGDILPQSQIGAIVAIADKIDTIVGCFGIGIVPTGSQDPYALRRQAAGICQIIRHLQIELPIDELVEFALHVFADKKLLKKDRSVLKQEVIDFFMLRVKNSMQEDGIRYDCIDAILAVGTYNILDMFRRAATLQQAVEQPWFKGLAESYNRIRNIASKADASISFREDLFKETVEKELFDAFENCRSQSQELMHQRKYDEIVELYCALKPVIDRYFEKIMVMDENIDIRQNRLAFLQEMHSMMSIIGDFSKIFIK